MSNTVLDQLTPATNGAGDVNRLAASYDTDVEGNSYRPEELARLIEMNRHYTHIEEGDGYVISIRPCPIDGRAFVFTRLTAFKNRFLHEPRIGGKNAGTAWLAWPGKNHKSGGIGFYPMPERCPPNVMNTFPGFAVTPLAGDVAPILDHIERVICNGDRLAYDYLIGWLAHLLQKPHEKPAVAVAMKSVEGAGKGTLFRVLKYILGPLALQTNGHEAITGRFNSQLANRLLVCGDEVNLTNPQVAERLKGLISEPYFNMEGKGRDAIPVANYARLMFASNNDRMIRAGVRERRYLVLEVSDAKAQDKAYFDALNAWIDDGGPAALLHHLLDYDLSQFDPQRAPPTDALRQEKIASLRSADGYLYEQLSSDRPFDGQARIEAGAIIADLVSWAAASGEPLTTPAARSMMGKALGRIGIDGKGRSDRGDGRHWYELPSLEAMRQAFAKALGESVEVLF